METIGRYVIEGELGRGAMGVVYRAKDPVISRVVAIKRIRLDVFQDPAELEMVRQRLFREAQSAGCLSHSGIVTVYDIQEDKGMTNVFMEFVDGEPLDNVMRKGTLNQAQILNILRQSASALDYAHSMGIVHRDIKPANILIRKDGVAKIADFGVAKIQSQSATQTGMILGTPSYMSPEQVQGLPIDGRSDQFSLAVMAFEMLTGSKPFKAESLATLIHQLIASTPMNASDVNPTLPAGINAALHRALSREAKDRYPNCAAFIAELAGVDASWEVPGKPGVGELPTMIASSQQMTAVQSSQQVLSTQAQLADRTAAFRNRITLNEEAKAAVVKPARPKESIVRTILALLVSLCVLGLLGFGALKLYERQQTQPLKMKSKKQEKNEP